ncbi:hypothetical protein DOK_08594 [gamma proteobacterium BDW918]|nr:hypothetical protein DOK_08594 [gamma proteobacterium BDW918]
MKQHSEKVTFTLPSYVMQWLDHVSLVTGYSKSNLVMQAIAGHLHKFRSDGTPESSLYAVGRLKGEYDDIDPKRVDEVAV